MEEREQIFRLMYMAFVEIRVEAYEKQNAKIFHIADIFHTIPLQLERVNKDEITYEEVLSDIRSKAKEKDLAMFFENFLKNAFAEHTEK
jgi:HD-GYP domain-containing protein (c-di-GMP phosphodiesterase class II)